MAKAYAACIAASCSNIVAPVLEPQLFEGTQWCLYCWIRLTKNYDRPRVIRHRRKTWLWADLSWAEAVGWIGAWCKEWGQNDALHAASTRDVRWMARVERDVWQAANGHFHIGSRPINTDRAIALALLLRACRRAVLERRFV